MTDIPMKNKNRTVRKEIDTFIILRIRMYHLASHRSIVPEADSLYRLRHSLPRVRFFIVKAIPHKERLATLCGIALICFAFTQRN